MDDHPLPPLSTLGNIRILDDEPTDDGMCSSVSSDSCCFVLIITAISRSRINFRAIATLTLAFYEQSFSANGPLHGVFLSYMKERAWMQQLTILLERERER
jgi:hypothetical protein